jgi:hypothetical protein
VDEIIAFGSFVADRFLQRKPTLAILISLKQENPPALTRSGTWLLVSVDLRLAFSLKKTLFNQIPEQRKAILSVLNPS